MTSPSSSYTSSFFSRFCSSALRSKPLSSPADAAVITSSGDGLVRRLGLFDLILMGIGASIGAGIFVVTGTVARDAGPGVTLSFIIAGACCVLNALCYAELASRFPAVVGGAYLYTYSAFNELTAFLVFAQLMLDYHIGAASIARSLASYVVTVLELIPFLKDNIPSWVGHGEDVFGALSINILAPILLVLLTVVLCRGVGESSILNSIMTVTKILIVIFVIIVGAFKVDVSNWTPFAPNGFGSILTGATVVFFSYVGFDAVANSAEESKRPQRDLPLGIIGSLVVCMALYIGVCLVLTGMVPYQYLGEDAPLAEAFTSRGLKYVSVLISFGAVAGLTTTLLVGLYVQSRLYLGLGRDGLLPAIFAKVHPNRHTPVHSQVWVGLIAIILSGLFNVRMLSHILSVGTLTGYSVVSACVISLRWKDKAPSRSSTTRISTRGEGIICLLTIACCGFIAGVLFRYDVSFVCLILATVIAIFSAAALYLRQVYIDPPGFSCPGVPIVPSLSIFLNMFLFAQLHYEAWVRFVVLIIVTIGVYAFYGQYHADPLSSNSSIIYHRAPAEEAQ
ncbi:Cationic amino acid transporter 9, chloroplastic [Castilleja foliolosa]|uniref:Cationic amino acid transporter 9, chloroplastic n=1 Tax=Castilleja foliolosa TaxID=1961234 RepID=A0ABD3BDY5_9LAMI